VTLVPAGSSLTETGGIPHARTIHDPSVPSGATASMAQAQGALPRPRTLSRTTLVITQRLIIRAAER
jgi:hypothetical protein